MNDSPAAILFDSNGNEIAVESGAATPANTRAIMAAGSDGTNSLYLKLDSSGRPVVVGAGTAGTPGGGVLTVQGVSGGTAIKVDGSAVTQPVSGTVTANAGSGTFAVSGTVAATQSGTWTVQPGNTANTTPWLATLSQGGNSATVTGSNALKVDGSAVTQPVSGTVTANIGTSGSLALDATLAKLTIALGTALGSNTQALVGGSVTTAAPSYTTGNINPLSLTTSGLLRVDGSGVTQPVSGTVAATQSGTWTVQPGNTANTTPWLMTGSGTAGTAATGVLTVQGISGGVTINVGGTANTSAPSWGDGQLRPISITLAGAVRVDGSAVTQPVSGTVTANIGTSGSLALEATQAKLTIAQSTALGSNTQTMVGGSVTTAAPSYTTGNINPLSLTTAGLLRVDASGTIQAVTVSSLPVDTYTVTTVTASSSGNTTVVTPAGGKKVRLHYVAMNADGANAADVTAYIRFTTSGSAKYKMSLKAGAIFARNVGAGRRYIEGAVDEALVINLSAAQTVNCTVEYEEI